MKKEEIKAVRFEVEEIGKHVKSSKKRFNWTFSLEGKMHSLTLDFSFISGKVKLLCDRRTLLENELPADVSFQHPFTLDGYALNILQQGETFELRINNKVFSHLYNQTKTNTEFSKYEDEIKDIKVEEGSFQNASKTVKLNIGGMGGTKKKTKTAVESENWGSFGKDSFGFPNYFGDNSSTQVPPQQKPKVEKANLLDDDEPPVEVKMSNIEGESNTKEDMINFEVEVTHSQPPQQQ